MPLEDLQRALVCVVEHLSAMYGQRELWSLEDWHEHDGYLTSGNLIAWEDLASIVRSPAALYEARCADDYVRRVFFDRPSTFLLRIWVLEEDDDAEMYPGRWGNFDISGPSSLLDQVSTCATFQIERQEAASYFGERYAG